ncbi:hypothetical protein DYB34_006270, partial [Aphanomyces astaci]
SVGALLKSYQVLRQDFGSVSVRFGSPIHLKQFVATYKAAPPVDAKTGSTREQYSNMIGLGYYRNKILHWFYKEGVVACTFHALSTNNNQGSAMASSKCNKDTLLQHALFLHELLAVEFVRKEYVDSRSELDGALTTLTQRRVFAVEGYVYLLLTDDSQPTLSLLCAVLWPFIDSYWVAVTSLLAIKAGEGIPPKALVKRMQWLAETGTALEDLASKIGAFRKLPLGGPQSMDLAALVTEFPSLSKL